LLRQFLSRELRGAPRLWLATYRDVEVRRQHPLSQTLGELNREGLSQRILLRGLTARDVARFIEITAGAARPSALLAAGHLSEACNRVLTVASVIGREFELRVLERVVGAHGDAPVSGDRLLEALEE